ncbi:SDR family NAD(P)-dependent oxidoreductase [Cytobacillus firmus]|uniref:SDR family NAD(P)-dependent oxidoreductase n=1 Tax=Cytobacillus firmus TaxID=1399 RepID=UPI0024954F86|nr:SDR family NAD(P)-dependent oxidoreductase [Cytobacillus firmus]
MKTILVTGGAGFIGSHLTESLLEEGHKVIVVDNLSMGSENNLPENHKNLIFIKADISKIETIDFLFSKYFFDNIFHLGAIASVAASVKEPLFTHETNLGATLKLLEAARKQRNLTRFVFASSAAVYGDDPILPKKEESSIVPLTPYAIDKYASEQYVLSYNKLYNLPTTALRFFNVFGPRQNPSSPYSGVVSIITEKINKIRAGEQEKFTIFGDGNQTRDFVYVKDVVRALLLVGEKEQATGKVFNVGSGQAISLIDLLETYERITHTKVEILKQDKRAGDILHSFADINSLRSIGFNPKFDIKLGLKEYWDHEQEKERVIGIT